MEDQVIHSLGLLERALDNLEDGRYDPDYCEGDIYLLDRDNYRVVDCLLYNIKENLREILTRLQKGGE